MKNNKFIALVAILSQLTGISAKANTPKISSDSVKTSESKKAKMNKQKKKKLENRSEVSSEEGYKNLYLYGFWGLNEILSLCGGDSWWKYPSYASVVGNLIRFLGKENDQSLEAQMKKLQEQAEASNKKQKEEEEEEEKEIKKQFGQDANVEDIKGKVKKIQEEYKKHFKEKTKDLAKLDDNLELEELKFAMNDLANRIIDKQNVISGIISDMKVDIKNLKNHFNSRYKKEDPKDSYGIYDVVNVDKNIVETVLSENVKAVKKDEIKFPGRLDKSFEEFKVHIDNDRLKFFLIFSSSSENRGKLLVSLVCCRNLSSADKFIRSEAKNVKDPSGTNPFWGMFIGPYDGTFLECDIDEIENDKNENSDDESDKSSENNNNEDDNEDDDDD